MTHKSSRELFVYPHSYLNPVFHLQQSVKVSLDALEAEIQQAQSAVKRRVGKNNAVQDALQKLNDVWDQLHTRYQSLNRSLLTTAKSITKSYVVIDEIHPLVGHCRLSQVLHCPLGDDYTLPRFYLSSI